MDPAHPNPYGYGRIYGSAEIDVNKGFGGVTLRRTDVVAVEVYREHHEVPPEYRRYTGRCGLVIYWTEDGWHNPYRGVIDRP